MPLEFSIAPLRASNGESQPVRMRCLAEQFLNPLCCRGMTSHSTCPLAVDVRSGYASCALSCAPFLSDCPYRRTFETLPAD